MNTFKFSKIAYLTLSLISIPVAAVELAFALRHGAPWTNAVNSFMADHVSVAFHDYAPFAPLSLLTLLSLVYLVTRWDKLAAIPFVASSFALWTWAAMEYGATINFVNETIYLFCCVTALNTVLSAGHIFRKKPY